MVHGNGQSKLEELATIEDKVSPLIPPETAMSRVILPALLLSEIQPLPVVEVMTFF
jgi:hypothetical protein